MNKLICTTIIGLLVSGCANQVAVDNTDSSAPAINLAATPAAQIYIRKNASTEGAQADLKALNIALTKMRAMGCDDPRSWYSQGATHSIPNSVANKNPLCPSYTNISQKKWGWDNCTHRTNSQGQSSEILFLLWHRLYIQHFEAIVRQLSGKTDFALPYWDYTNTQYRIMPAPLRDQTSSLYEAARKTNLNAGATIDSYMNQYLDTTNLFENNVFSLFNSDIDNAPHGVMHSYIGTGTFFNKIYQTQNSGLMARVQSAGFDPVFWLHHSNIDYLWQKWENSPNGSRPTKAEISAVAWDFQFISPSGTRVTYTSSQAYDAAFSPNYVYEQLVVPVSTATTKLLARRQQHIETIQWADAVAKPLIKGKLSYTPKSANLLKSKGLKSAPEVDALALKINISFAAEPKGVYGVYIESKNGKKELAGFMNFFGADHHASMEHHHHGENTKPSKTFLFDVTDELNPDEPYNIVIQQEESAAEATAEDLTLESVSLLSY
jgi:hypothetical protein